MGASLGSSDWPFAENPLVLLLDCLGREVELTASSNKAWLVLPDQTVEMKRIHNSDQQLLYVHETQIAASGQEAWVTEKQSNHDFDWKLWLTSDGTRLEKNGIAQDCQPRQANISGTGHGLQPTSY